MCRADLWLSSAMRPNYRGPLLGPRHASCGQLHYCGRNWQSIVVLCCDVVCRYRAVICYAGCKNITAAGSTVVLTGKV